MMLPGAPTAISGAMVGMRGPIMVPPNLARPWGARPIAPKGCSTIILGVLLSGSGYGSIEKSKHLGRCFRLYLFGPSGPRMLT